MICPTTGMTATDAPKGAPAAAVPIVTARQYVRPLRGGSQAHLLEANDGYRYVTKFRNNPQAMEILANEYLAARIGRDLGLSIPVPVQIEVQREFVRDHPELSLRRLSGLEKCATGLAYGSRVPAGPDQPVFDYLPDRILRQVVNQGEWAGILLLDQWLANCDTRQAIFIPTGIDRCHAYFIDHGFCFNAGDWNFLDSPLRGIYPHHGVYDSVMGWESFEPWLSRIEGYTLTRLQAIADELPDSWIPGRPRLRSLIVEIDRRRERLRQRLIAVRGSALRPFRNWVNTDSRAA